MYSFFFTHQHLEFKMATSQGLLIHLPCEPILWSGRLVKFDTHGRMQVKCFQWELARRQPRCAHRIRTATSWPWETYCECEICECVSKWGKTEFLKLNNKQTVSFNSWKNNSYLAATNWQQLLLWWSSGAHNWRCTPDWREEERERERGRERERRGCPWSWRWKRGEALWGYLTLREWSRSRCQLRVAVWP